LAFVVVAVLLVSSENRSTADRLIRVGEIDFALTNVRRGGNETWTPELLDQFLANPKKFAPGTKMEFQGLLKEEDREALIEHLKSTR
jgi:cytochrome c2